MKNILNKVLNIKEQPKDGETKILKIEQLSFKPEFQTMLKMDDNILASMTESMKKDGFKQGHEVHVWFHEKQY